MPSERPVNMPMSPAHAAQLMKVSRRTIMRAIENHELKANRDNRNRWKIAPDDLDVWAGVHCAPSEHAHKETPTLPTSETVELAVTKAENRQLLERLAAAETDRDHWRNMAAKLAKKPRRFWLWGK